MKKDDVVKNIKLYIIYALLKTLEVVSIKDLWNLEMLNELCKIYAYYYLLILSLFYNYNYI